MRKAYIITGDISRLYLLHPSPAALIVFAALVQGFGFMSIRFALLGGWRTVYRPLYVAREKDV